MTNSINQNLKRPFEGPDTYEHFNRLAIAERRGQTRILRAQLILLVLVSLIGALRPHTFTGHLNDELNWEDYTKLGLMLAAIAGILGLMIVEHRGRFLKSWSQSRRIAEQVLSEAWLTLFRDHNAKKSPFQRFQEQIVKIVGPGASHTHPSIGARTVVDHDEPEWMKEALELPMSERKDRYVTKRLNDQIGWYEKSAHRNQRRAQQFFYGGIIIMGLGAMLAMLVVWGESQGYSYIGFSTTVAASMISWQQTRKYQEQKTSYAQTKQDLEHLQSKFRYAESDDEIRKLVTATELVLNREHQVWLARMG